MKISRNLAGYMAYFMVGVSVGGFIIIFIVTTRESLDLTNLIKDYQYILSATGVVLAAFIAYSGTTKSAETNAKTALKNTIKMIRNSNAEKIHAEKIDEMRRKEENKIKIINNIGQLIFNVKRYSILSYIRTGQTESNKKFSKAQPIQYLRIDKRFFAEKALINVNILDGVNVGSLHEYDSVIDLIVRIQITEEHIIKRIESLADTFNYARNHSVTENELKEDADRVAIIVSEIHDEAAAVPELSGKLISELQKIYRTVKCG